MDFSDEEIMARIIHKLYRRGNWGESHTSFENIKKGFNQRDLGKKGLKRIVKVGEQMIKSGLLHSKQTKYGLEVSLEFTQKDKLIDIMKRVFHDDEYV